MLGTIDFSQVKDFTPVAAGRYPGETFSWELVDNKSGDGQHILAKFKFEAEDEETGEPISREQWRRYSLKPNALWALKRDLINLGVDPEVLAGTNVDLEALMNEYFGTPMPVWLTLSVTSYTPQGSNEARKQNELTKLERREA